MARESDVSSAFAAPETYWWPEGCDSRSSYAVATDPARLILELRRPMSGE